LKRINCIANNKAKHTANEFKTLLPRPVTTNIPQETSGSKTATASAASLPIDKHPVLTPHPRIGINHSYRHGQLRLLIALHLGLLAIFLTNNQTEQLICPLQR
jgi:hypothetical protein